LMSAGRLIADPVSLTFVERQRLLLFVTMPTM